MKSPATKVIIFNAAAVLITVSALVGVLRSYVFKATTAPCTERYLNATNLALERGGVVLAAADLQSSVGGNDAGLLENLAIGPLKGAPSHNVINVKLPQGSGSPWSETQPKGGISFPWQPRATEGKTAVCLSYSVLLPESFAFHRGGVLPGIRGTDESGKSADGFLARLAWRPDRRGGATLRVTTGDKTERRHRRARGLRFPAGPLGQARAGDRAQCAQGEQRNPARLGGRTPRDRAHRHGVPLQARHRHLRCLRRRLLRRGGCLADRRSTPRHHRVADPVRSQVAIAPPGSDPAGISPPTVENVIPGRRRVTDAAAGGRGSTQASACARFRHCGSDAARPALPLVTRLCCRRRGYPPSRA